MPPSERCHHSLDFEGTPFHVWFLLSQAVQRNCCSSAGHFHMERKTHLWYRPVQGVPEIVYASLLFLIAFGISFILQGVWKIKTRRSPESKVCRCSHRLYNMAVFFSHMLNKGNREVNRNTFNILHCLW